MQGRPLDERELLDAESVAGHLVEAGSVFALLAAHRRVGVEKNNAWLHTRTAALNLRRLLNLDLTRHDRSWALA